ncbi:MAG: ATP-binding protein [Blastocatellia bacterium AA13]|nr:MAG: ATP-binding protein [Blastocatellia bacterium AA13]
MTATAESAEAQRPYSSNLEHLEDELRRLNLLIRLRLSEHTGEETRGPLDQFKGLILTDSEIARLLREMIEPRAIESAEPERSSLLAGLGVTDSQIEARLEASRQAGTYLALPRLSELFNLGRLEQQCLLIGLAPEIDRRYEKLYAYLHDDVTQKKPSIDLALSLTTSSPQEKLTGRSIFGPRAPLAKYRLIHVNDGSTEGAPLLAPLLSRSFKIDDRIAELLLGTAGAGSPLDSITSLVSGERLAISEAYDQVLANIINVVRSRFRDERAFEGRLVLHLNGPYGSGKRCVAEGLAYEFGLPLLIVDAEKMIDGGLPLDEYARLAGREAVLLPAILCFENFDALLADERTRSKVERIVDAAAQCSAITLLLGRLPWRPLDSSRRFEFVETAMPEADDAARARFWRDLTSRDELENGIDFEALASRFRFTRGQIRDAIATARSAAQFEGDRGGILTMSSLAAACRAHSGQKLNDLARKVEPSYGWNDIVLSDEVMAQLLEICQRVVLRHRVMGDWGFGKKLSMGKGVNALFAGPSGTGKTMASEILARELELDLYKIDLSGVVSKYIGETEKNLDRVFKAAEDANAILFFDEADALFGKRSEVRDSHDRYANIEISYLLQKMEEYEGLAILATNLKANLDESFTRRLAFTVHFPFPDEASRLRIWQRVWPEAVPLHETVDLGLLANRFKLSGGNIKNIALAAAFLAAGDGGLVTMPHLIHATRREYQKLGKQLGAEQLVG